MLNNENIKDMGNKTIEKIECPMCNNKVLRTEYKCNVCGHIINTAQQFAGHVINKILQ